MCDEYGKDVKNISGLMFSFMDSRRTFDSGPMVVDALSSYGVSAISCCIIRNWRAAHAHFRVEEVRTSSRVVGDKLDVVDEAWLFALASPWRRQHNAHRNVLVDSGLMIQDASGHHVQHNGQRTINISHGVRTDHSNMF